jgi:hypothetical protein
VDACDDNSPQRCDSTVVYVTVIRENFPPQFLETPYSVAISQFRPVGDIIFKVNTPF